MKNIISEERCVYHLIYYLMICQNDDGVQKGQHPIQIWYMMTSSNGNIFRLTGRLCGEFTGPGEFSAQRPVTRSFDVFFDLRLNKRLSKQPWGWWFETPSWSLWRQCNNTCNISNRSAYYLAFTLTTSCVQFNHRNSSNRYGRCWYPSVSPGTLG